jgi:hypothetical protein
MNIKELIEKLQTYDPNTQVMIHGYEGGYSIVGDIKEDDVVLDYYTEWYYGNHESKSIAHDIRPEQKIIKAVILE